MKEKSAPFKARRVEAVQRAAARLSQASTGLAGNR
jgi:hypothetical protein